MKKKVMCLAAAFFFLLSILEAVPVYAAVEECNDVYYDSVFSSYKDSLLYEEQIDVSSLGIPLEYIEGKYYSVWKDPDDDYYKMVVSDSEQYFYTTSKSLDGFLYIYLNHSYHALKNEYVLYQNSGGTWHTSSDGINLTLRTLKYSESDNVLETFGVNVDNYIIYANHNMYTINDVLMYTPYSELYDEGVGYLQNLTFKTLMLEDVEEDYKDNFDSVKNVWTFDGVNSFGVDITDGNWLVRMYGQIVIHKGVDVGVCENIRSYDMVLLGSYPTAPCRFEYKLYDVNEQLYFASGFDGLNWWESNWYHVDEIKFFQLVRINSDGTMSYGNLIRVDPCKGNTFDAVDPDGYEVEYGGSIDVSTGSGRDYDQAENNADNDVTPFQTDFTSALTSFIEMIGAFPQVVNAVFSFLPPWMQAMVVAAFGLIIALIIYKFLRG